MTDEETNKPSTKRKRLGAELRKQRKLAGFSGRSLAARIDVSQAKLSRIELGETVPSLPEVRAWVSVVGASDELLAQLTALTEAALTDVEAWRDVFEPGLPRLQQSVGEAEAASGTLRSFQPTLVPGLLQTAEYARRVFTLVDVTGEQDYQAAIAQRLDRQQTLYDTTKYFEFLLTEAVLRWRPGPPTVLVAQLDRIASVATLDNVSLGIVPFDTEATAVPWHGFTLYEDRGDHDPYVAVEAQHAYITVSDPQDIEFYRTQLARLRETALVGDDAREFLASVAEKIR